MPRLTAAHLEYIGKGLYRKPVLAERETFRLAGLMTLVQEDRAAVSELWHLLDRELRQRAICAEAGDRYGLCWYPAGWQERGFLYMAAVEMYEPDVACTPLVVNALPALTWVRFLHKGPLRDLSFTLEYVYHTWLPKSEKRTSLPCNVERYGKRFPNADDQESEIEIYFPIE